MTAAALRVPTLTGALLGCCSLADKTLRSKLAYRLSTLISVVVAALGYCIFLLVWSAVYRENPDGALLPKRELFAYLVVALVFNSTFSLAVEFRFALRLRQGLIATDLIRPLGFLPFQLAQAVGDALGNLIFSAPIYAVGWLFLGAAVLPASALSVALGLVSLALAFLINFGLSYLLLQIAFVTHSLYGVINARLALHQALSGLAAPLAMFPETLRNVAVWLPFRDIIETPVRIWLGLVSPSESGALLLRQLGWAVALLVLGMTTFRAALRRHQVQGG